MRKNINPLCLLIVFLVLLGCKSYCDYLNDLREEEIKAVISGKYESSWNRGEKSIYLDALTGPKEIYLTGTDKSKLWEHCNVGDSILKEPNSLRIVLRTRNKLFSFDLEKSGCQ